MSLKSNTNPQFGQALKVKTGRFTTLSKGVHPGVGRDLWIGSQPTPSDHASSARWHSHCFNPSNEDTKSHSALTEKYHMLQLKNDVFEDLEQEQRGFEELVEEFSSILIGASDANAARTNPDKSSSEH